MMDRQEQTSRRTSARVKAYGLQHESVLSREPSRGRLCVFRYLLAACISVQTCDINYAQARFGTHRALRLDFQSPFLPGPLCAGETKPQSIVMIEYRLQSAHKMLVFQT